MLTVPQAAAKLRVSEMTVRNRINDGTIPATKFGRYWQVPENVTLEKRQPGRKKGKP
jgi:excisionase family DNA binding protein